MAKLFDLTYHDDPGPKRTLSGEDIGFLSELAKEMRTQDSYGNASPRYFGLMEAVQLPSDEDHHDGACLYDRQAEETFFDDDLEGAIDALCAQLNDFIQDDPEMFCTKRITPLTYGIHNNLTGDDHPISAFADLWECLAWNAEHFHVEPEDIWDVSLYYYRNEQEILKDALFLTQKSAQDYLKKYGYNHSDDCHSYVMTAQRSPEYERLLDIIMNVDWDNLDKTGGRKKAFLDQKETAKRIQNFIDARKIRQKEPVEHYFMPVDDNTVRHLMQDLTRSDAQYYAADDDWRSRA